MSEEYCHGCYRKLPCECRTDFYDENGKVIDSHESKLRKIIKSKDTQIKLLEEALGFYADGLNECQILEDESFVYGKGEVNGKHARQALAELKKMRGGKV